MINSTHQAPSIWHTFNSSPLSSKIILFGVMINRLSGFLQIFIVIYLVAGGYSHEQTIIALGLYGTGAVIGALIGGSISDRFGVRAATMISMGSTAILTAVLLYMSSYGLILFVVLLASLSAQLFRPASATLLSRQTPPECQTMIFAIYRLGLNLGSTAAPLIGYAIYNFGNQSFVYVFWCEALIAGMYALLAMATLPRKIVLTEVKITEHIRSEGYAAVLSDRRFLFYLFATFCHSVVYVQYTTTLPLYTEDVGYPLFWYTLAISLNGMIVICFELLVTKFTQSYGKHIVITVGFSLVGIGVACYSLPIGPAVLVIGTLIWSLGEIVCGPAFSAWPANAGPDHLKAHYLGSFHFMFSLGNAVGPIIGGWLYLQIGGLVWPVIASGSIVAAIVSWYCVRPRIQHPQNEHELSIDNTHNTID